MHLLEELGKKKLLITWKLLSSISIAGTNQIKDLWYFIRGKGLPLLSGLLLHTTRLEARTTFLIRGGPENQPFPLHIPWPVN